jgi:hypothetical protein
MSSNSDVIRFPKKAKARPEPEPTAKAPWWQNNATWALKRAAEYREIDALLGDRTRSFLLLMKRWPSPPSPKQVAWLEGFADLVEHKLAQIKGREANKSQTDPPAA